MPVAHIMRRVAFNRISALICCVWLAGCATEPTWSLGKKVDPPLGCQELRQRTGNPDEC